MPDCGSCYTNRIRCTLSGECQGGDTVPRESTLPELGSYALWSEVVSTYPEEPQHLEVFVQPSGQD
jgi:hypothetical protein